MGAVNVRPFVHCVYTSEASAPVTVARTRHLSTSSSTRMPVGVTEASDWRIPDNSTMPPDTQARGGSVSASLRAWAPPAIARHMSAAMTHSRRGHTTASDAATTTSASATGSRPSPTTPTAVPTNTAALICNPMDMTRAHARAGHGPTRGATRGIWQKVRTGAGINPTPGQSKGPAGRFLCLQRPETAAPTPPS